MKYHYKYCYLFLFILSLSSCTSDKQVSQKRTLAPPVAATCDRLEKISAQDWQVIINGFQVMKGGNGSATILDNELKKELTPDSGIVFVNLLIEDSRGANTYRSASTTTNGGFQYQSDASDISLNNPKWSFYTGTCKSNELNEQAIQQLQQNGVRSDGRRFKIIITFNDKVNIFTNK